MSTPSDSLHSSPSGVVKTLRPVEQTTPASGLVDLMGGDSRRHIRIGEHGFVALVDVMPRLVEPADNGTASADAAIVQAARVSYGAGTKKVHEDRGLIRYLLRHRHTTPFEMVEFKFHVSMPIFVARQWIRHRTANVNEYSGRYSEMPDHFYRPDAGGVRLQSTTNKQGGEETIPAGSQTEGSFFEYLDRAEALYEEYQQLMEKGVSRELARIALPQSVFTQWYWKCDLHNTLRFLSLRMDSHAQKEIRDYAEAMCQLIEPLCPFTIEAWRDYELESVHLTRLEIEAIREQAKSCEKSCEIELKTTNKREQAEWDAKRAALGFERAQA
ncbi:MAG: FAD-dependent thymidylate synthase [Phycisphaeraceae bacterium]|nr:FAD-dependent thymidylate synthase [Phycisphaerales bacterium]MCB9858926.1 FAD-dependent thymidylate synthase [Phycisphaeraceae bacterium]